MPTISEALSHEKTARYAAGQWRCSKCGSTVYVRFNDTVRQKDAPPMYSVEWLCWMGAHCLKESWYKGSPIQRPKVTEVTETQLKPRLHETLKQEGSNGTMRQSASQARVVLIKLDTERGPGCSDACRLVQYSDPTRVQPAIYETIMHDPAVHEAFGRQIAGEQGMVADAITYEDLTLDLKRMSVTVDGRELTGADQPTATEWKILHVLAAKAGRVMTQREILTRVWGVNYSDSAHLLRVNMARLRKKLDPNSPERFIQTRPGIGYVFGIDYGQAPKPVYGVVELKDDDDAER